MGHQQGLTVMSPPAPPGAGGAMPATCSYWRLSATVTACLAADRVLFLDVACDRYLALPAAENGCFLSWLQSPGDAPPSPCRAMLAELGISSCAQPGFPCENVVARPPCVDSVHLPRKPVRLREILSVGRAVMSASRDVRSTPLAEILAGRFPAGAPDLPPTDDLQSRLAIFRSARPLIPIRRVCLHDCLALLDWLGPDARGVSLVLGVSARPFAAHSWLQAGDALVDDHPESPSRYQPILHLP